MPLPEDDDYIAMTLNKKGEGCFLTPDDMIKFMEIVGETVFESLEEDEKE